MSDPVAKPPETAESVLSRLQATPATPPPVAGLPATPVAAPAPALVASGQPGPMAPEEEVWLVSFTAKTDKFQPNSVQLSVNGEQLVIKRETEVWLPQRFLEVADHATYPVYTQLPNESRKISAHVTKFPYRQIRQGTMADFIAQRADGTRESKRNIQKYGMDGQPPDQE